MFASPSGLAGLLLAVFALVYQVASVSALASSPAESSGTRSHADLAYGELLNSEQSTAETSAGEEDAFRAEAVEDSPSAASQEEAELEGYYTTERLQLAKPHLYGIKSLVVGLAVILASYFVTKGLKAEALETIGTGFFLAGLYSLVRTGVRHWWRKQELEVDKVLIKGITYPKVRQVVKKNLLKMPLEGGSFMDELNTVALVLLLMFGSLDAFWSSEQAVSLLATPVKYIAGVLGGVVLSTFLAAAGSLRPFKPAPEYRVLQQKEQKSAAAAEASSHKQQKAVETAAAKQGKR